MFSFINRKNIDMYKLNKCDGIIQYKHISSTLNDYRKGHLMFNKLLAVIFISNIFWNSIL